MHIQRKGTKDKPISEAQQRRNHRIAKTRARIEHVFAGLAQMGGKTLRSIGLARARLHLNWKVAAYNRKRDATLSITHKFCPDIEAELDVNKTRQSAPHDSIAWWSIMSTVEVSAQLRNLVQIVG
jgi:hypothetical protein